MEEEIFNREKADLLYNLLDLLYNDCTEKEKEKVVCKTNGENMLFEDCIFEIQYFLNKNYLTISDKWNLKK